MKIAVTIWEDRISPVFDASRRLLIVDIENAQIGDRVVLVFDPEQPSGLAKTLANLDVKVLICGAVSQLPAMIINAADITLIPFITGQVDRVLKAFAKGDSLEPAFVMPGCHGSLPATGKSTPPESPEAPDRVQQSLQKTEQAAIQPAISATINCRRNH